LTHSVYTKDENSCVVAKTKPQSVITTAPQLRNTCRRGLTQSVGWLIYSHSNITPLTSGKSHPNYTSWSVYCFDPVQLSRS